MEAESKTDAGQRLEPQHEDEHEEDLDDDIPIEAEKKISKPQASETNEQVRDNPIGAERRILKPQASNSNEQKQGAA